MEAQRNGCLAGTLLTAGDRRAWGIRPGETTVLAETLCTHALLRSQRRGGGGLVCRLRLGQRCLGAASASFAAAGLCRRASALPPLLRKALWLIGHASSATLHGSFSSTYRTGSPHSAASATSRGDFQLLSMGALGLVGAAGSACPFVTPLSKKQTTRKPFQERSAAVPWRACGVRPPAPARLFLSALLLSAWRASSRTAPESSPLKTWPRLPNRNGPSLEPRACQAATTRPFWCVGIE